MKKLIMAFALLFGLINMTYAQEKTASIKGLITDTLNKQNLSNAIIAILRKKDSVLVSFTRSLKDGSFELKNLPEGQHIVMISYPNYADYVDVLLLDKNKTIDLGKVPVITKATLLQEVIVKQRIGAIRVKGDTTEYRADSFKVSANADVQELLRKMPGIQVNSKGEITAQGERVQKVLVDGEEFFSDDPAVVTKNLRADAIEKVQAFDKKSDQAAFTGIDDGQKIKTLNLTLKEDKKKGYFGKAEAGTDFDRYYSGKLLANSFKAKRKISGYLTTDNNKFQSLNWDENRNYAGDANTTTEINDDGGMMIFSSGDEFSWGRGFPNSITGGLHFSNKWNKDKYNTNNTYQFNQQDVTGITTSKTQTILPDTSFINTTIQDQVSSRKRNKITSIFDWQIDSSSSLKVTLRSAITNSNTRMNFLGSSISEKNILINSSNRTTSMVEEKQSLNTNLLWRKKYKKTGRTFTINTDINLNNVTNDGFLIAQNDFYNSSGVPIKTDLLDQKKINKQNTSSISSNATYTEPIWKNTFLIFNYRLNLNKNNAERNTLSKNNANNKYENLVDTLSNHFLFNTAGHTGGINIRYNVKKFNFSAGSELGTVTYRLNDLRKNTDRSVNFTNFIPQVTFNYTPKQQRRFNLSYKGSTQNPSLIQIQPIIDNIDPLNIVVGNPNLQQAFIHTISFGGNDYKVLKSRNIYFNSNFSSTENAITNENTIDSLGRRISKAINVNGNYNFNAYLGFGTEVFPSVNVGFSAGPTKSRFVNRINGIDNITNNSGISLGINAGYWGDKKVNFWMNANARNTSSNSSIRPDIITRFWTYDFNTDIQLKLKKIKTYVNIEIDAEIYQKTPVFANQQNVYLVNSSIRKVISKNDQLELKFEANDIFNQNRGINRNASSNFISETINQTIQRFFLFSVIWNFNKNGKAPNEGF